MTERTELTIRLPVWLVAWFALGMVIGTVGGVVFFAASKLIGSALFAIGVTSVAWSITKGEVMESHHDD